MVIYAAFEELKTMLGLASWHFYVVIDGICPLFGNWDLSLRNPLRIRMRCGGPARKVGAGNSQRISAECS
jgi:hypothetical protein